MKVLVVANQKGGVGKTATVVHFAYYLTERLGKRVAVIDLDTQGNATYSLSPIAMPSFRATASALFTPGFTCTPPDGDRGLMLFASDGKLADMERVSPSEAAGSFVRSIDAIRKSGVDVVLIDTAPSLANTMASALAAATHLLSPIELELYSILGIGKLLTAVQNMRKVNPDLTFIGMLPSKVDSRNARHAAHLKELRAAYGAHVLPMEVPLRTSIADALATRRPVWKIRKTTAREAAKELIAMMDHVADRMECK
ncbi:chromosome partitioning protein [Azospirillum brasilense]|nr:chromosome partitioning protein [Azospirillum brasilense]